MADSCFGCCSIRSGVVCISVFNVLLITVEMMIEVLERLNNYDMYYRPFSDDDTSPELQLERIPLMSDIFMDYILILKLAWSTMELYLNVCLKTSTNKNSPEKVYCWLVVNQANLIREIILGITDFSHYLSLSGRDEHTPDLITEDILNLPTVVFAIVLITVELYAVRSHYCQQKLAAVTDSVQLKWKYQPTVQSDGTKNTRTINKLEHTAELDDESKYIPIFIKNLRRENDLSA